MAGAFDPVVYEKAPSGHHGLKASFWIPCQLYWQRAASDILSLYDFCLHFQWRFQTEEEVLFHHS